MAPAVEKRHNRNGSRTPTRHARAVPPAVRIVRGIPRRARPGFGRQCITYVDRDSRVLFVTQAAAEWLGFAREQIVGSTLRELHEPASFEFFEPYLQRALAGERVQYERGTRHADGHSLWISVSLSPHRDASGEVVGVLLVRPRGEGAQAHPRRARARAATRSRATSRTRRSRWSNSAPTCASSAGRPRPRASSAGTVDEVRGRSAHDLGIIHPDSRETVRSLTHELIERGARRNRMLVRNHTKDARTIWCEWYNSAFFDENGQARLDPVARAGRDRARGIRGAAQAGRGARCAHRACRTATRLPRAWSTRSCA